MHEMWQTLTEKTKARSIFSQWFLIDWKKYCEENVKIDDPLKNLKECVMSEDINQASLFYIRYILTCLICNLYLVNFLTAPFSYFVIICYAYYYNSWHGMKIFSETYYLCTNVKTHV